MHAWICGFGDLTRASFLRWLHGKDARARAEVFPVLVQHCVWIFCSLLLLPLFLICRCFRMQHDGNDATKTQEKRISKTALIFDFPSKESGPKNKFKQFFAKIHAIKDDHNLQKYVFHSITRLSASLC